MLIVMSNSKIEQDKRWIGKRRRKEKEKTWDGWLSGATDIRLMVAADGGGLWMARRMQEWWMRER